MQKKRIVQRTPCQAAGHFDDGLNPLLQRIYLNRGIVTQAALQKDLSTLPTPDAFKGMPEAIALLENALYRKHRVTVIGDFDADGATSTALAVHCLRAMGFIVDFLVPNRFEYGYGLTPEIVEVAIGTQQTDLIITVDNGIASWQGVALARAKGVSVLITDHHLPAKTLPEANAIVNPNQPGCPFPGKNIAGVGVIFYVMSALRKKLRDQNHFEQNHIPEPNMADYLDLVALGTVADVVALDNINRTLVHQGILRMRSGRVRPGIAALATIAKRPLARLVSSDLGFAIAPRLNAAGRMDDMSTGVQCLLCAQPEDAQRLAMEMDKLNHDRKRVEQEMQQQALQAIDKMNMDQNTMPYGLCVFDKDWHQGVVGLLASRLKERYHRPVIAFAPGDIRDQDGDIILKGSARSVDGLHIRDVLDAIASQQPGLIEKFGGHAMAAGLSLPQKKLSDFTQAFDHQVRLQLGSPPQELILETDGELAPHDFQVNTAGLLRNSEPWGQHFPAPVFEGCFRVLYKRAIGEQHLRLVLNPENTTLQVDAIVFFIDETLKNRIASDDNLRITYQLDINHYQGDENLQLIINYLEHIPAKSG